jgi:hypothetical protein
VNGGQEVLNKLSGYQYPCSLNDEYSASGIEGCNLVDYAHLTDAHKYPCVEYTVVSDNTNNGVEFDKHEYP